MTRKVPRTVWQMLGAWAVCVPLLGLAAYLVAAQRGEAEAFADLRTIADLKASQIDNWLAERVADGRTLARSPDFADQIDELRQRPGPPSRERLLTRLSTFREALGYRGLTLVDEGGGSILDVGAVGPLTGATRGLLDQAIRKGDVVVAPIVRDGSGSARLDFILPVRGMQGDMARPGSVLVLHVDPREHLLPLIQAWPTVSPSGEIMLLRRSGERVEVLSELRRHGGTPQASEWALDGAARPASLAVLEGRPGQAQGPDHRDVTVLAAYRPVGPSDWMLLVQIDRSEALSAARALALWVSGIAALALGFVVLAALALLRRERVHQQSLARVEGQQVMERFFHLPFIGMAATAADSGRWLQFNDRLCEILGFTREELAALGWTDLTHPDDRHRDVEALDAMRRGDSDGYSIEKRLLHKEGRTVLCNVDSKCVRRPDGQIDFLLDTVEDITQRKATEGGLFTISRYYAALSQCDEAIVRCQRESELFPAVCEAVVGVAGVGLAWIGMVDDKSRLLVPVAQAGMGVEYLRGLQVSVDPASPLSQGPTGTAMREGRPYWCADFAADPRTGAWHTQGAPFGWTASASLPLMRGGQTVGALSLYFLQADALNDKVRALLEKMAANISFALDALAREAERGAAIDALRLSEARFRQVFESSIDGILLAAPDGRITSANAAASRMLGWSEAELRGLGRQGLLDPADPGWSVALEERNRTGRFAGELAFVRKDGTRMPVEVATVEFDDSFGYKRSSLIFRDITERKRSEELLRAYAEQLAFYFSASPVIGYRLALRDDSVETVWVSDNIQHQMGYTLQEVFAPGWWQSHLHPEHSRSAQADMARLLQEEVVRHEYRFAYKDGSYHWIRDEVRVVRDATGAPSTLVGAWSDITDRVQADMELRKLSLAVEQSPESIVITNIDAEIEYVNETFLRVTGFSRAEVIGRNPSILHSGQTPVSVFQDMWATLSRGEPWKGQFINRRKDGSDYTEFAIIAPIRQNDGRITHYLAIKDDVTDKKRMGEELDTYRHHLEQLVEARTAELAEARARAEAANVAKSAFLANMSHEIRTPMNAIIGLTHLMLSSGATPEQATRLRKIAASGHHLLNLVNDILDLSKIEAGKLSVERVVFKLRHVLDEAFGSVALRAEEKGLRALCRPAPDLPLAVRGDPLRLGQILLNLLSNAVKFTDRGEVDLDVSAVSADAHACMLRFEVRDTGIGMTAEQQSRLFQAFEQADASTTRKYGGTGLGLAICQRLVAMLGGRIGVDSQLGRGSCFWFELPFVPATIAELPATEQPAGGPQRAIRPPDLPLREARHLRILLVEDDLINQEVAVELLNTQDYRVDVAVDGADALRRASESPYDLILMDLQMPVMDGFEATRKLRQRTEYAKVPIIAMTANVFPEDQKRCAAAGMDDFIAKPVDPDRLLATVAAWTGLTRSPSATVKDPSPADGQSLATRLAGVHGLNVETGLRAVRGRWASYERLLRTFLREHAADAGTLREKLRAGDIEHARRTAHTLKGLAGTIGMRDLQQHAEQLERALHAGLADPLTLEPLVEVVSGSLQQLVDDLLMALPSKSFADAVPVDGAAAMGVARALLRLLEEDDATALDLFDREAQVLLASMGPDASALDRHMHRFEFDSARELLAAWLAKAPA